MIYDGLTKSNFNLHCYVVMWTGDIPAISKLMNITGHNSYMGCRFCYLKGIYCYNSKHVYYPCTMPKNYKDSDYDPLNLPKRTEHSFKQYILLIENEQRVVEKKDLIRQKEIIG